MDKLQNNLQSLHKQEMLLRMLQSPGDLAPPRHKSDERKEKKRITPL